MDKELLKLPVLSIRQPWAWLIANGYKDVENRNWKTKYRGKFLIHAGKSGVSTPIGQPTIREWVKEKYGIDIPQKLEYGGIVGVSEITDCVKKSSSPWFLGDYGFVLENSQPLTFHPCNGQLNFFHIKENER